MGFSKWLVLMLILIVVFSEVADALDEEKPQKKRRPKGDSKKKKSSSTKKKQRTKKKNDKKTKRTRSNKARKRRAERRRKQKGKAYNVTKTPVLPTNMRPYFLLARQFVRNQEIMQRINANVTNNNSTAPLDDDQQVRDGLLATLPGVEKLEGTVQLTPQPDASASSLGVMLVTDGNEAYRIKHSARSIGVELMNHVMKHVQVEGVVTVAEDHQREIEILRYSILKWHS